MLKKTGLALAALILSLTLTTVVSTEGLATFGQTPDEQALEKQVHSSTYRLGRFQNTEPDEVIHGAGRFFKILGKFYSTPAGKGEPGKPLPIHAVGEGLNDHPASDSVRITWLGHAALFIEIEGARILTDPAFSERASPLQWMGPKRFHRVPVAIEQIPQLDAIIISHDHYDHLDYHSILKLASKTKHFFVPLGVGNHLQKWGVDKSKITELDWWQEANLNDHIRLAATPAQHFSGRGLFSRNTTLWASWAILGQKKKIYFSGDTGMFSAFKEIGKRYGPFDYTLMHVGAYSDEWPKVHMTPEEAVQAHIDIGGKIFVPIHWGTFRLAFHDWNEPAERLYAEAQTKHLRYVIPIAGESISNPHLPPVKPWWRDAG